ncbi:rho GTPase-activating protein 7 isoform X1 [Vombatus ursinus]|uniref:Rho GTPase-activating protein 7 n=1 Tax=Vombatus ursinus TaxID=29139 RepID=A0A4X2K8C8_VOMUR|nr:rho GTPase-activating protein 7 isoform X1 [Vombatus ursinus]XP_027709484.1 rho GTPase-activating protein 7 isoform X1 [Vombatus ursinus]
MSVAVRKRSWEEHVTQRMGLLLHPDAPTPTCHHGLVADSLHTSMEKERALTGVHHQRWASLPDCCQASELSSCPEQLLGNVSRELDGNDTYDGEEGLLSLEASTETLVHVSDEDNDAETKLGAVNHWRSRDRETAGQWRLNGTGTFVKMPPDTEEDQESPVSLGSLGKVSESDHESVLMEESRKEEDWDLNGDNQELGSSFTVSQVREASKADFSETLSANEILPEKQLLHSAVIAQQRRKYADTIKDRNERRAGEALRDGPSASHCAGRAQPLSEDSESYFGDPPCCFHSLDESGVIDSHSVPQKKHPPDSGSREGMSLEHGTPPVTTGELCGGQVTLREKKEVREDRGRGRLDSMALLIMKLDQLDRDIENALSTSPSPASPQAHQPQQRPIPDEESREESGENDGPVHQDQTDLPPNLEAVALGASLASVSPTVSSATKPKALATPSASEKGKAEIEAKEACDWLRAAGFPQYAQLYEDLLFPIDITLVKREHDFLDRDSIEALYRRLNTLNKCAVMKLEISPHRKRSEDSDEDEPCAISGKWTFQRDSKRWSRMDEFDVFPPIPSLAAGAPGNQTLASTASRESLLTDLSDGQELASIRSLSSANSLPVEPGMPRANSVVSVCSSGPREDGSLPSPTELPSISTKAQGQPAKAKPRGLLKRMESLKLRRSHTGRTKAAPPKLGLVISGPVLQEGAVQEKLRHLHCVEISSLGSSHFSVPGVHKRSISNSTQTSSSSSSSQSESGSAVSTPSPVTRTRSLSTCQKRGGMYLEGFDPFDQAAFDSVLEQNRRNRDSCPEDTIFYIPEDHKPGTFPKALSNGRFPPPGNEGSATNWRAGSFHGHGRESAKGLRRHNSSCSVSSRLSVYDNVPGSSLYSSSGDLADLEQEDIFPELDDILCHVKGMQRMVNQWSEKFSDEGDSDSALDSVSPCPSSPKQTHLQGDNDRTSPSDLDSVGNSLNEPEEPSDIQERRDSGVGASLTRSNRPRLSWQSSHQPGESSTVPQISSQSVAQMNLLQKYSLLKLTALLERHTPSNKHGFSWAVPKFMKRLKVPDYKDRSVFGVPLSVNVQRTGQPLPQSIQQAMGYLHGQCLDQVGLFRKSGVKSRIQALRQMNESSTAHVSYDGQSAYDVADMLKQYFRDLPEPLMTNKLSETFLQIYQYVPKDQRLQAIQAAIMLLPDENREVLQTLLCFLSEVTAAVKENQMTPTNLAVCLAPSLFHLNTLKRENSSPRVMQRKQSLGKPDQKDLNENLAATQGLAHMIAECHKLFQVPEEMSRCRNSYSEQELRPLSLEALGRLSGQDADYRHFLQDCVDSLFKEVKDKFKGWVSHPTSEQAELAYKKVSEGPPLRLWKSTIEVPAKAEDVLNRLLKEQHIWDPDLLDAKVIEVLDSQTEIYQFVRSSMVPHPARDHVVLRTWRTNLPRGACMLLLTSVDHAQAPVIGVRVNVLLARYLVEPCGAGRSKLTYMCRSDLRGHIPEWYTKAFGHLCVAEVVKIRDSFSRPSLDSKDGKSR